MISQLDFEPHLRNIPPGRIAIGSTVSELTITLCLTPDHFGHIEAWVRDLFNIWGEGANKCIVYVASSFTEFLNLLRDSDEVYSGFWHSLGRNGEILNKIELP